MEIFEILKKRNYYIDASNGKLLIYLRKGEKLSLNLDIKNANIIIVDLENRKMVYGKV